MKNTKKTPFITGMVIDFHLDTLGHKANLGVDSNAKRLFQSEYMYGVEVVSKAVVEADVGNNEYNAILNIREEVYSAMVEHKRTSVGSHQQLDTAASVTFKGQEVNLKHVMKTGWLNQALVYEGNLKVSS